MHLLNPLAESRNMIHPQCPERLVFRQVAFPVSAFDYLKDYQRAYEQQHGIRLNNNQCVAMILAEHRQASSLGLLNALGGAQ